MGFFLSIWNSTHVFSGSRRRLFHNVCAGACVCFCLVASSIHRSQTILALIHSLNMVKTIFDPIFHSKAKTRCVCAVGPKNNISNTLFRRNMRHTLGLEVFHLMSFGFNICTAKYIDKFYFYDAQCTYLANEWRHWTIDFRGFCNPLLSIFIYSNEMFNKSLALWLQAHSEWIFHRSIFRAHK